MLNPKSLLKVLTLVVLSFGPIVGMGGVARSNTPALPESTQKQPGEVAPGLIDIREERRYWKAEIQKIPGLIQMLRTGTQAEKDSASQALMGMRMVALPYLIPLLKDPNTKVRSTAVEMVDRIVLINHTQLLYERFSGQFAPTALSPQVSSTFPGQQIRKLTVDEAIASFRQTVKTRNDAEVRIFGGLDGVNFAPIPPISTISPYDSPYEHPLDPYDEAVQQLVITGEPAVPKLVALLQDDDVAIRSHAQDILRRIQPQSSSSINALSQLLQSPDAYTRSLSAQLLGGIGKPAKPRLLELLNDPNPNVTAAAAYAISRLPGTPKSMLPALILKLKDKNPYVRAYALMALGNLGEFAKPAIPSLSPLRQDDNEQVRPVATALLNYLSQSSERVYPWSDFSFAPIISRPTFGAPAAKSDPAKPVRPISQVIQALQDAEEDQAVSDAIAELSRIGKPAIPALLPLLNNPYQTIRIRATNGLSRIGQSAIPSLLPLLKQPNSNLRKMAVLSLSNMEKSAKTNLPVLIPLLQDPDPTVQSIAEEGVRGLIYSAPGMSEVEANGDRSWLRSLFKPLLKNKNAKLRAISVFAIGRSATRDFKDGDPVVVPDLIPMLKDPDINVRSEALKEIRTIGKPAAAAIPHIIPLLKEPSQRKPGEWISEVPEIRVEALSTLSQIGKFDKSALPDVLPFLKDPSSGAQNYALDIIANMGQDAESAIPDLLLLLKQTDKPEIPGIIGRILDSLGEPGKVALPVWISLLQDSRGYKRSSAASVLGKIGASAKSAIPNLIPLLKDPDENVRSAAAAALKKLDYKP
jgi:HEAT repeat protein